MSQTGIAIIAALLFAGSGFAAEKPGELQKKELTRLLTSASSPRDHLRLAAHYTAQARRYDAEAAEHLDLAKGYRGHPSGSDQKRPMAPDTAAHCDYLAETLAKAAKAARALAAAHESMAK